MLRARQSFPQVGSYSLYEREGASTPVRILQRLDDGFVQVSLVERPEASGYRTLRLDELENCDALAEVERNEMRVLSARLHGRKRPRARDVAKREDYDRDALRWEELRKRDIRAAQLDQMLDRIEEREKARQAGPFFRRTAVYA